MQCGLTFRNLNKHPCFIVLYILIWGGLELCFGGLSPPKPPRGDWTVWKNFSLLSNAIDSEKYLGCTICQACKICQTFCL